MTVRVLVGDCRAVLPTIESGTVQCCVTSPPYYGLRDYGTASWGGGDPNCDHVERTARNDVTPEALARRAAEYGTGTGTGSLVSAIQFRGVCGKCGAISTDNQIGLESTVDEYVTTLVDVFREVRRILKDDGTLWVNIGDSYARSPAKGGSGPGGKNRAYSDSYTRAASARVGSSDGAVGRGDRPGDRPGGRPGTKVKDLLGVPWMLAFALRDDGWFLRCDIIWAKPNGMPESVTDRPTRSHEYIFLLSKSSRYYYDADAVRRPLAPASVERLEQPTLEQQKGSSRANGGTRPEKAMGDSEGAGANLRSVWSIATMPYSGAHFAVMAPRLAETCILAGSRPGDTVLDPFGGAGTTGLVADRNGRDAVLVELSAANCDLATGRVRDDAPLFFGS